MSNTSPSLTLSETTSAPTTRRAQRTRGKRTRLALIAGAVAAVAAAGIATGAALEPRAADVPEVAAAAQDTLRDARSALAVAPEDVSTETLEDLVVQVRGYGDLPAEEARELTGELAVESAQVWVSSQLANAADVVQTQADQSTAHAEAATAEVARLAAERAAAEQAAAEAAAALAAGNTVEGAKATARTMAANTYGWGDGQFSCLESLWTKESSWDYQAQNSSSGAYGIPQSLPGTKMATAGADWQSNATTQIAWGLDYISRAYGTPCAAWGHSQAVNWY